MRRRAAEERALVKAEKARALGPLRYRARLEDDLDAGQGNGRVAIGIDREAVRQRISTEPWDAGDLFGADGDRASRIAATT